MLVALSLSERAGEQLYMQPGSFKEQLSVDAAADCTLFHQFTSLELRGASLCLWEPAPKSLEPSHKSKGCLNVL